MNTSRCRLTLPVRGASILVAAFTSFSGAYAADVVKADNTTALQNTSSWVGSVLPTATDRAVWDSTLTGANTSYLQSNLSVQGLFIDDPAGDVTIRASGLPVLSIGSLGIEVSGANLTLTDTATIDLVSNQTWSIASGRTLSLGSGWGNLTGSADLEITGPGSMIFDGGNGARIYTFGTGALTLGGDVRLINDATDVFTRTRTITNATTLNGDIILQADASAAAPNNADSFIFSGGLDLGSVDRTITLSLPDLPNTVGAETASRGVLDFTTDATLTGTGTVYFVNESLDVEKRTHVRTSGGLGTITVPDINIGENVSFTLKGGAADIGADTAITVQAGGALALGAAGNTTGGTRTIKSLAGAGTVTSYTSNATLSTLVIDGGASTERTEFSGSIQDNSTTGAFLGLVKSGTSTQVLSGTNDYTRDTIINGGQLIINGSLIQSAEGLGVIVNSGGTLGGNGLISINATAPGRKAVELESGSFLAPGDGGIGTLTLNGANFTSEFGQVLIANAGSQFNFDLAGDGTGADTIDFWNFVEGDVLFDGNAIAANLALDGSQVSGTYTVSIFNFFSDDGTSVVDSGLTTGLIAGSLGAGISDVSFDYNEGGSTIDVTYTVTAVPEPSTFAAIFGGIALAVVMIRRRRS